MLVHNMRSIPQNRSLAQQLSRSSTLFGALVVAILSMSALTYALSWGWLIPELERSTRAGSAENAAHSAMLDEETGLRAYLLTHDARDIEPYTRGGVGLVRANEELVVSAGSEFAAEMVRTRLAEERWHERWAKVAAETPPEGLAPPMAEGNALFDAYRTEEAALANAIDRRTKVLAQREQWLMGARVPPELALLMALLFLIRREHRALRDAVVAPLGELLRHVGRVRDGQLEATVDQAGLRELRELGQGMNEMVRTLATARGLTDSRSKILREHSSRLRQILEASREFSESLNLAYVVAAVRASTAAVAGYEGVIVWLMDDEHKRLRNTEESRTTTSQDAVLEIGEGLAGRAAKSGRITFECPQFQVSFTGSNKDPVRAIAIPLIVGARVIGVLEARSAEAHVATDETVEVIEMLAMHAATAIESARLHELTEERAQMDVLTRLFNRRRLEENLDAECKRCVRYERPLAFVMLDVDHFKAFNDAHGHPLADTALQELAEVIASAVRATDTAYRYGGEEFCVLLRETSAVDAMHFAERLRQRIQQRFASGALAGITASFGVAEFSVNAQTPRALVEAADAAMYESKHAGRNRVSLSSWPPFVLRVPKDELEPHLS